MKREDKRRIIYFVILFGVLITLLAWSLLITPVKAQAIETVPGQLIKVYETELPYEFLSDDARRFIRICFLGQIYEYGNNWNTIDDFFRLALSNDEKFDEVVLLVAYLNLPRNQLIFFYIYKDWLASVIPII